MNKSCRYLTCHKQPPERYQINMSPKVLEGHMLQLLKRLAISDITDITVFIQGLTPFLDLRYNKINRLPEKNRFADTEKFKLQKSKFLAKEHKKLIT